KIRGELITLLDAISMVGQYQTIAINLGSRDGVGPGTLLRIRRVGAVIPDKAEDDPRFTVKLPDQDVGMAMIIRSSEKLSYALVMSANQPIHINDYVISP
ncbi:MAG: peptidoglycan-binding protein, partial [Gammaproteobacteria bacterium]|nr:peptidoglycan-binding protein [Gammaproteobacteria bacterium]